MFRFAHIEILYFLLLIPFFVVLFIAALYFRKKALQQFGELRIISQLMPQVSQWRPIAKFILIMLALISIIIGFAGPQFGSKLEEVKREGVEIIIALDVSNSMLAEDIKPNRLEKSKRAISKMVEKLDNDKIGLIVFAGDAYVQVPITTDYSATKMFLSTINPGIVPKQGTAIGSAINLSMSSFGPETDKNKVLIIITDGENHEDDAIEQAIEAQKKGITIHTVGMGHPDGTPIPMRGTNNFRKDKEGVVIISKLDETTLQKIASAAEGIYIRATNSRSGLKILFDEIEKMDKTEFESKIYSDYEERFQYFFGLGLFFLLLEFILLERKNKLLQGINIFKSFNWL